MKRKSFSVEQITAIVKQAELGAPVTASSELCRQYGVCQPSFYRWKTLYGGMAPSESREL